MNLLDLVLVGIGFLAMVGGYRLGFLTRTHAGSYALDPPPPTDHSPARSRGSGQSGRREDRGKVQRPQRSEDERP